MSISFMLCEALLTYMETPNFSIIMLMAQMVAWWVPFSLIFSHCRVLVCRPTRTDTRSKSAFHTTYLIPCNYSVFPLADARALFTIKRVCFYLDLTDPVVCNGVALPTKERVGVSIICLSTHGHLISLFCDLMKLQHTAKTVRGDKYTAKYARLHLKDVF